MEKETAPKNQISILSHPFRDQTSSKKSDLEQQIKRFQFASSIFLDQIPRLQISKFAELVQLELKSRWIILTKAKQVLNTVMEQLN
jgi:hypothetical protein